MTSLTALCPRGASIPCAASILRAALFLSVAPALAQSPSAPIPTAVPARPTVTNPAHIPTPGYLQFEQGFQQANNSPDFSSQLSLLQATKIAFNHRLMVLIQTQPIAHSTVNSRPTNDTGDLDAGIQYLVFDGNENGDKRPTIALEYLDRARAGTAPSIDIGSYNKSALLLASGDIPHLHYDTNFIVNEQNTGTTRRAQLGQTLLLTHNFTPRFALAAEIWHFTQPLSHGNAIGNLWTIGYTPRPNIVFDAGFNRGLTTTSTQWETFAGITYVLPHRFWK